MSLKKVFKYWAGKTDMKEHRRYFILSCACLLSVSGCLSRNSGPNPDIKLRLYNNSAERKIFHFALEDDGGIDEWITREVNAGTDETVSVEVDRNQMWNTFHGVIDDHVITGELISPESASCIELRFISEIDDSDEPEILQDATEGC
ncbi:hypothetical protein [Natrarchaeobius oligotrophus]|uniref:hypothetical protein n=1 Tax=Natrarchaeobius oligotrophus TaxID=3455743 RepID=UPI000F52DB85|nr:hypothetical protein [Natrarchaeobius chitinivorans]